MVSVILFLETQTEPIFQYKKMYMITLNMIAIDDEKDDASVIFLKV